MKFLILALALLPALSFADFRPGRVRAEGAAQMQILSATGIYKNAEAVSAVSQVEDGKGLVSYAITVDDKLLSFSVTKEKKSNCGNRIEAIALTTMETSLASRLSVRDMSFALCDMFVANVWEMKIETRDLATGEISTLEIGGNPKYFARTM